MPVPSLSSQTAPSTHRTAPPAYRATAIDLPMIGTHFTQPPTEQEAIAVVEAVRRELQPVSLKFQILGFMLLFGALAMYVLIGLPQRPHLRR